MKLTLLEKRLLEDLFKSSEGLFIYTLYQRFNLSPKVLFLAAERLTNFGFIQSDNIRLSILKEGINFVINSQLKEGYSYKRNSKIPDNFLGPKIEINQFYIPKINKHKNQIKDLI